MPRPGGQPQTLGRARQQGAALRVGLGDRGQQGAIGIGIATRLRPAARHPCQQAGRRLGLDFDELALAVEGSETLALNGACCSDARGDIGRAFGGRRQGKICGADRRHIDVEIDAIEQRSGDLALIVGAAAWRAAAAWLGSIRWPQRQGFIAATSWKRAG